LSASLNKQQTRQVKY